MIRYLRCPIFNPAIQHPKCVIIPIGASLWKLLHRFNEILALGDDWAMILAEVSMKGSQWKSFWGWRKHTSLQKKMPDSSRYATLVQLFGLAAHFESLTSLRWSRLSSLITLVYATPYVQSHLVAGSAYLTRLSPVGGCQHVLATYTTFLCGNIREMIGSGKGREIYSLANFSK